MHPPRIFPHCVTDCILCDAGCDGEIVTGPPVETGLQYVEYFKPGEQLNCQHLKEVLLDRTQLQKKGILNLAHQRVGFLAPDPGGIIIWTFPNYAALEEIICDHEWQHRLKIIGSGVYRSWGAEIL
jgi:hypothetical protein